MTKVVVLGIAVVLGVGTVALVRSQQRPANGSGQVAFVMALEDVGCQGEGTACFVGNVTNTGSKEGDGTCRVVGFSDGTGDTSTEGPVFTFTLGPSESTTVTVVWTKAPEKQYAASCDPGPVA
jgi:hypothetical protein